MAYVIIRCNNKPDSNWSGKEWSRLPCKIYSNEYDALDAIKHYWYGSYNLKTYDHRQIVFIPLTEKRMQKLISEGKARL